MTRRACVIAILAGVLGFGQAALAADAKPPDDDTTEPGAVRENQRPDIDFYRWKEDWSFLADPRLRTTPGDSLKYMPLSPDDPKRYLSLGITLRERFQRNDAPLFGTDARGGDTSLLHRLELHADAHLLDRMRAFVQFENALAPGLQYPGPSDANKADLRLAFVDTSDSLGNGIYTIRAGRQEVAFDLQRFSSVRDGLNVRQAFDALWAQYDRRDWRVSILYSQPVRYRNESAFDDYSSGHFTFGGMRAHLRISDVSALSATWSQYRRDNAHFLAGSGDEDRRNLDLHYNGAGGGFDWDIEGMVQQGSIGGKTIRAWAVGSLAGYTFSKLAWRPRLGLQFDAASGDADSSDRRVGTFNPLFPNGVYMNQSGYTGYSNLLHLKESLTLTPAPRIQVLAAIGELWRQTTNDAVYASTLIALPATAHRDGKRTATYMQLRIDWRASRNLALAVEANHYDVASVIRNAGGHDSDYVGVDVRWGW